MTANQINFAALQETKRSNLAKEDLTRTSNTINLEHYLRADKAALSQADTARMNAFTNQRNADINAYNASIAKQNAETNAYTAQVRKYEADQQARQAAVAENVSASQIALNQAKANESLVNAWSDHPILASAMWVADNAHQIVSSAKRYASTHPAATTQMVRIATASTPSVLVNAAAKSIIELPTVTTPARVQGGISTKQGGRRHE